MAKTFREGVDVEVTFASQMKRARAALPTPPAADAPLTGASLPSAPPAAESLATPSPGWQSVRAGGRFLLRLSKPLLRPVLSRVRRYLTAPLQQDWQATRAMLEDTQHGQAALRQEIRTSHAALLHEVHVAKDRSRLDLQGVHVDVLREVHASQDAHERASGVSRDALLDQLGRLADQLTALQRAAAQPATSEDVAALGRAIDAAIAASERAIREATDQRLGQWHHDAAARIETQSAALQAVATTAQLEQASLRIDAAVVDHSERLRTELADQLAALSTRFQAQLDRVEAYAVAAARRVVVNCGPDTALVRSAVGYVLCDSTDHAALALLLETGEMEPGTRLAIQAILQPGDCFVDVGANIGLHTLAGAKAIGGRGRVLAVEPFEPTASRLEKTIWMNGLSNRVEVRHCAAYSRPGRLPLFLGETSGHHSLLASAHRGEPGASVDVPVATLDSLVGDSRAVALVKIDVEGAELHVLAGAQGLVRDNPAMGFIVEFAPAHLARSGESIEGWLGAFNTLGLVHREIDADLGTVKSIAVDDLRQVTSVNLLFARPDAALWRRLPPAP